MVHGKGVFGFYRMSFGWRDLKKVSVGDLDRWRRPQMVSEATLTSCKARELYRP